MITGGTIYYLLILVNSLSCCKKSSHAAHKKQLKAGVNKLNADLDISHIIDSLEKLKILMKVTFNDHQRQLLSFNQNRVLDSGQEKLKISKLAEVYVKRNNDQIKPISHKMPLRQQNSHYERVDKLLDRFKTENLDPKSEFILSTVSELNPKYNHE